jgi:4'-phosphopantetheinyl transferase
MPATASEPRSIRLTAGDVQLWHARVDDPTVDFDEARGSLSSDELARANALRQSKHARCFVVRRAVLRSLLARYLDADAAAVRFQYGLYGKPRVVGAEALSFSVSHSAGLAIYGFSQERHIGVDLERVRAISVLEIARRYFAPDEVRALQSLPVGEQRAAFFRCWTRKEAYLKAKGVGLSLPLDSFAVSLAPLESRVLRCSRSDCGDAQRWRLLEVPRVAGYAVAAVVDDPTATLQSRRVEVQEWMPPRGS